MRRLVAFVLVLSGLGYLAMDWRSRNEAKGEEPLDFADRPSAQETESQEPLAESTPAQPLERPVSGGGSPAPASPVDDGTLADLGFDPEPEAQEPSSDEFYFPDQDVDPLALPMCLLESWRLGDSSRLSNFLNEGEGKDLPEARKQLMLAFWRALRGDRATAQGILTKIGGEDQVTSTQLDLARRAAGQEGPRAASMGAIAADPLARAMRMVLGDVSVEAARKGAQPRSMAEGLSDLLLLEIGAPWQPRRDVLKHWAGELAQAQAGHRMDPSGDWEAVEYRVQSGDNLQAIRKKVMALHPGLNVCVGLIREVNGLGQYIHEGDVLRIPTRPASVVVDLDARLLLYLHGGEVVGAWEVGIGQEGQETPIGDWTVGLKLEDPAYMPVGKTNLPYGHPDNPLGDRWIALARGGKNTSYGIHGTSDPDGVGGMVSLGCVRMRNEDVVELFELLPLDSAVRIQP